MASNVFESAWIKAPIEKVWGLIRPMDFKFLPSVTGVEAKEGNTVGSLLTISYKDGTKQTVRLTELSDSKFYVSYELVESVPAAVVAGAAHTIRCTRITSTNTTLVEVISDFSKDATPAVIVDRKYKSLELLNALQASTIKKRKNWMPLESNPILMNKYIKGLGAEISGLMEFQDVYSLEPDMLTMVQAPQFAILLCFPINEAAEKHRQEEAKRIEQKGQVVSPNLYFLRQTVGNACGTVGLIHAVLNNTDTISLTKNKFFSKFLDQTKKMDANQRAKALEENTDIEVQHEAVARDPEAKSDAKSAAHADLHFICLTAVDGHLYELDGRKQFPVNHGATNRNSLLFDSVKVIQEFMQRAAGDPRFNIVALAPPSE